MKSLKFFVIFLCIVGFSSMLFPQGNFSTSLHATRAGKNYWYGADITKTGAPAPGFESLTGVPIDHPNVACNQCHSSTGLDANGDAYTSPYPGASCVDCHATKTAGMPVSEDQCLNCHSRQKTEFATLNYTDVHRSASTPLKCWACHKSAELHGNDGVKYNSLFEPGAMNTKCEDCHNAAAGTLPNHAAYDPHGGSLDCDACHSQTVISCYNCHFESQVENHLKRAKQPIHGFVMLANIAKTGKIGTISFQSLSYQGKTWAAFGPYHGHAITDEGRKCSDCHANFGGQIEAISQYNSTGLVKFATWNSGDSTLSWLKGVVPMPADFKRSFRMDFLTYNGSPADPVVPSKNWSTIGKDTWDGHQMFFATPLTEKQMAKIGFDTTKTTEVALNEPFAPVDFNLEQNYPNPFNPETNISFYLPQANKTILKIYNMKGQEIETLWNQELPAGRHHINFNAKDLPSGIYVYQLQSGKYLVSKKMMLMK